MVKIQIDINEEQSKALNIIKAHNGFKTKAQAVVFALDSFFEQREGNI